MTERKTIYLDDALEAIRKLPNAGIHWFVSAEAVFDALLKLSPAQPEWKKGKWLFPYDGTNYKECSVCGATFYSIWNNMNFCPNCGADMSEGEQE